MRKQVPLIAVALIAGFFLLLSGCVTPDSNNGPATTANATATPIDGKGGPVAQATVTGATEPQFSEWKAPDGSITLQVPTGWTASEKQADTCTVNWGVQDPAGTSSAYMTNEIIVLKSEYAHQLYAQYGVTGLANAPLSAYLTAEQAVPQIIAPISGATNVQIVAWDAEATQFFARAACTVGFAACDAQVFEATYDNKGTQMRGKYMVHTYDFGEGTTWWINVWGYTAPADSWNKTKGTLEKIFSSAKYTDSWAQNCKQNAAQTSGVVNQVVKDRQAASDRTTAAWDAYIRGE